jgi:hypothetical protein
MFPRKNKINKNWQKKLNYLFKQLTKKSKNTVNKK